jgi:hypothetical protein
LYAGVKCVCVRVCVCVCVCYLFMTGDTDCVFWYKDKWNPFLKDLCTAFYIPFAVCNWEWGGTMATSCDKSATSCDRSATSCDKERY